MRGKGSNEKDSNEIGVNLAPKSGISPRTHEEGRMTSSASDQNSLVSRDDCCPPPLGHKDIPPALFIWSICNLIPTSNTVIKFSVLFGLIPSTEAEERSHSSNRCDNALSLGLTIIKLCLLALLTSFSL